MRRQTDNYFDLHFGNRYVVIAQGHLLIGAALVLFVLVFATAMTRASESRDQTPTRTTRDKVYSKEQAAKGAAQFGTVCAACHDPAKKTPDKTPGPPLVGKESMFVGNWKDHTIGEIYTTILTTMPNDGSVVLTESDTADLVAYLLQANGYPEGPDPLKFDAPSKAIQIVSVK
ncbi:MAG TPA: cytochrome c [Vicinamibacterales bacterium]|nr:cytochrome c [Vicinamibacterales bacterium]